MAKSTTRQGDIFERKVFEILKPLVLEGKMDIKLIGKDGESFMWTIPANSDIVPKDKDTYPWGCKVIHDIAIKSNQDFKILVECKGYTHAVDVSDIAEFITRVKSLNVQKGIFITSSRFQKGALEMAKFYNIALARIDDYDAIHWDLRRLDGVCPNSNQEICEYMCGAESRTMSSVYDFNSHKLYYSLVDYLCDYLQVEFVQTENKIPYLSQEKIEESSALFLNNRNYDRVLNEVLDFYLLRSGISVNYKCLEENCLGKFDVLDNKILISQDLTNDEHRLRFTIAHEIGHSVLHRGYLKKYVSNISDENFDLSNNENWFNRMEIQANKFAACLLMPKESFIRVALIVFDKQGRRITRPYYVDNQKCNLRDFAILLTTLSSFFMVSKETVRFRLLNLGMLYDCRYEAQTLFNDINSIV